MSPELTDIANLAIQLVLGSLSGSASPVLGFKATVSTCTCVDVEDQSTSPHTGSANALSAKLPLQSCLLFVISVIVTVILRPSLTM